MVLRVWGVLGFADRSLVIMSVRCSGAVWRFRLSRLYINNGCCLCSVCSRGMACSFSCLALLSSCLRRVSPCRSRGPSVVGVVVVLDVVVFGVAEAFDTWFGACVCLLPILALSSSLCMLRVVCVLVVVRVVVPLFLCVSGVPVVLIPFRRCRSLCDVLSMVGCACLRSCCIWLALSLSLFFWCWACWACVVFMCVHWVAVIVVLMLVCCFRPPFCCSFGRVGVWCIFRYSVCRHRYYACCVYCVVGCVGCSCSVARCVNRWLALLGVIVWGYRSGFPLMLEIMCIV